jgi:hypothetical protein
MIQELPEGLRAAAVLCFEDELSPSTASAVLGLKPGTLRKRLHDARAKLQHQIVEKAEKEFRIHLLPKDFAKRYVCRCKKAQEEKAREDVRLGGGGQCKIPFILPCDPLIERGVISSGRSQSQRLCNSVSMRVQIPPSRCRSESISPSPATGPQRSEAGINGGAWKPQCGYPV